MQNVQENESTQRKQLLWSELFQTECPDKNILILGIQNYRGPQESWQLFFAVTYILFIARQILFYLLTSFFFFDETFFTCDKIFFSTIKFLNCDKTF